MTADKIQYRSLELCQQMEIYTTPDRPVSAVARDMAARYIAITKHAMPLFDRDEWLLICGALDEYLNEEHLADTCVGVIRREIAQYGTQHAHLADRLTALSYAERMSMCDVVELYWAGIANGRPGIVPGRDPKTKKADRLSTDRRSGKGGSHV